MSEIIVTMGDSLLLFDGENIREAGDSDADRNAVHAALVARIDDCRSTADIDYVVDHYRRVGVLERLGVERRMAFFERVQAQRINVGNRRYGNGRV